MGKAQSLTGDVISSLRASVRGRVIDGGAAEYDDARRVFYSGFDRRPAAIVRVLDAADISAVVRLARDARLPVAVRNGGHSPAGHSTIDGGLVLDLSAMKKLDVDPVGRTAWADAGLTAGEYTDAVGTHGLATGFGDAGSVGISGITLSGGVGFLHRRHGLTLDNVLAADIVTASGEQLRVDAQSHPDLFWAIRGGGGNFGVVTRWQYRLHEVGTVLAGIIVFPASEELIPAVLDAVAESSDALSGVIAIMPAPPMPLFPPEVHGRMIIMANLVHCGAEDEAEREISRLRTIAKPIVDMMQRTPYPSIYHFGEPPRPPLIALRPTFVDAIDRKDAETIIGMLQQSRARMRVAQFRVLGGAVARVDRSATAFAYRHRTMMAIIAAAIADPAEAAEHQAWADALAARLPSGEGGAYVGFLADDDSERVRDAYPADTWKRLAAVKQAYDPDNIFHRTQNIPPVK